jgi:hypothetical protein
MVSAINFTPVPSLARMFLATPEHKFIVVMGPIGSTKTTSCLMFLLMMAARQAPGPDGIRRTRFGIIRNTLVALKQTVLKDIMSLFGSMAEHRVQDNVIRFRVNDIDSEWMLVPLETPEDQKRLLSLQLTAIYINELREVDFDLAMYAFSRAGRFPSMQHGGVEVSHRFLLADSNMGTEGSRLYKFLEEEEHDEVLYVHQPDALGPDADWLQYLPTNYYNDLQIGANRAWVETHVHARWSFDLTGLPIFSDVFNYDWHVNKNNVGPIPGYPLLVGFDPGFNPAAVIGQLNHRGQLSIFDELHAPNCLLNTFLDNFVMPRVTMPGFELKPLSFIMDPSGINRHAVTGFSAYGMLKERKLEVTIATTNDIDPRLKAIERLLIETRGPSNNNGGAPLAAIKINPCCEVLIKGLSGAYRYKKKKLTGELEDKPEKKHPISDVIDALGYLGLGLGTSGFVETAGPMAKRGIGQQKDPTPRGWT